jgi:hypothetical protein
MTRSDDEQTPGSDGHDDIVAKVRASLHGAATRTPIGPDRLAEIRGGAAVARPSHGWLQVAASVVAVAAIAGIVAVLHGGKGHNPSLRTGSDGNLVGSSSPAATSAIASPVPVGGSVVPTPTPSPGSCVPDSFYVIAAPAQLAGMTYILPSTPAGYQMYGAWGTISRNNCLDSTTWYVEYDNVQVPFPIQLSVGRIAGEPDGAGPSPAGSNAAGPPASPVASIPVVVAGHAGWFYSSKGSVGGLGWTADGLSFRLDGPITGGKPDALVALADSFVAVLATDPRIVAPGACRVPPGSTCPSSTDSPTATDSPTSTEIPTASTTVTAVPTPTPTPSPGG